MTTERNERKRWRKRVSWEQHCPCPFQFGFMIIFCGCSYDIQTFPGQGLNLCRSSHPSHSSHWILKATRDLPGFPMTFFFFFNLLVWIGFLSLATKAGWWKSIQVCNTSEWERLRSPPLSHLQMQSISELHWLFFCSSPASYFSLLQELPYFWSPSPFHWVFASYQVSCFHPIPAIHFSQGPEWSFGNNHFFNQNTSMVFHLTQNLIQNPYHGLKTLHDEALSDLSDPISITPSRAHCTISVLASLMLLEHTKHTPT